MSLEKYINRLQEARNAYNASVTLFRENAIALQQRLDELFEAHGFTPMTQHYADRSTEKFEFKHQSLGTEVVCQFNFSNVLELQITLDSKEIGVITVEKPSDYLGLQFKAKTSHPILFRVEGVQESYPLGKAIDALFATVKV